MSEPALIIASHLCVTDLLVGPSLYSLQRAREGRHHLSRLEVMPPLPPVSDPGDTYMRSAANIVEMIERELSQYETDAERDRVMAWVREHARCKAERRSRELAAELAELKKRLGVP